MSGVRCPSVCTINSTYIHNYKKSTYKLNDVVNLKMLTNSPYREHEPIAHWRGELTGRLATQTTLSHRMSVPFSRRRAHHPPHAADIVDLNHKKMMAGGEMAGVGMAGVGQPRVGRWSPVW